MMCTVLVYNKTPHVVALSSLEAEEEEEEEEGEGEGDLCSQRTIPRECLQWLQVPCR